LDIIDFGHNKVLDIEKDKFPFKDDSVDYIEANHFIEHLHDVKHFFNECHRVLKVGATMEITVPYGYWPGAVCPVHHQLITTSWFGWFAKSDNFKRYGYSVWAVDKAININNNENEPYQVHAIMRKI